MIKNNFINKHTIVKTLEVELEIICEFSKIFKKIPGKKINGRAYWNIVRAAVEMNVMTKKTHSMFQTGLLPKHTSAFT